MRPTNRIHRLLVIAGPSCTGKSTFLRQLENGSYPYLTQRLNVGDLSKWTTVYAKDVVDFDCRAHRNVLFHYALPFLSFRQKTLEGYEQDRRLDILGRADRVTIISLFADSETIQKRIRKRLIKLVFSLIRRPFSPAPQREIRRLLALRSLYRDPDFEFEFMCAKWISYCDTLPPHDRFLIDFRIFPNLLSADERGTRLERTATQEKLRLILDKSL